MGVKFVLAQRQHISVFEDRVLKELLARKKVNVAKTRIQLHNEELLS
jgi:hypothetical protein